MSHWFFFLENVCPSEVQIGNEIFGHFPGTDDGINSIYELVADDAVTKVTVILGAQKINHCKAPSFRRKSFKYFERYYRNLTMKATLILLISLFLVLYLILTFSNFTIQLMSTLQ